jgi:REP element-mobilizing transposase RayT
MEMETKNGKTPERKWEIFAGEKKPSMKRRLSGHDYSDRGIYMITMAVEGRKPLLGTLTGNPSEKEGPNIPHVILSPLGEKVKECWFAIHSLHPQIEILKLCIMPDHIHCIVFVHKKIEQHLGHVINGFKTGCRKAAKALHVVQHTEAVPQFTKHPTTGLLWEPGYNDRVLLHRGQLERMFAYLDDNPRRLLLKRQHPEYFTRLGTMAVAGIQMQAIGNRFLLDNPVKLQVQCSRRLTPEEIEQKKATILYQANDQGAILVSPCISPGEQQIATAALTEHIPLIVLLLKGFSPFFKPQPKYLEACTEGRLLMLSPYPWQNEKITNMRQRCLQLNDIAAEICKLSNEG